MDPLMLLTVAAIGTMEVVALMVAWREAQAELALGGTEKIKAFTLVPRVAARARAFGLLRTALLVGTPAVALLGLGWFGLGMKTTLESLLLVLATGLAAGSLYSAASIYAAKVGPGQNFGSRAPLSRSETVTSFGLGLVVVPVMAIVLVVIGLVALKDAALGRS